MGRSFKNIRETIIIGPGCKELILPDIDFLSQIGILFGGQSNVNADYLIFRPNPYYNQMIYTFDGMGQSLEDDQEIDIPPRTLFVTHYGRAQHYKTKGKSWSFLWFWIAENHGWDIVKKHNIIGPAKFGNEVLWIFNQLLRENAKLTSGSKTIVQSLCDLLSQYLREELRTEMNIYQQEILEKLNSLVGRIYADPQSPWDVESLSEQSGLFLSKSHFMKVFIENMGVTPIKMVTRIRMETAANLLKNTSYNLSTISAKIGYSTPYAFSDAFKRWFGVSPKEYRKGV